jgi:hypothetical protein
MLSGVTPYHLVVPTGCCGIQADHFLKENNAKLTLVLWSGPAGLWLWHQRSGREATTNALRCGQRQQRQAQQGRNSTHDVPNYSNPGKELWSGHGTFRGVRRRHRGLPTAPPHTPGALAPTEASAARRRKMDQCQILRGWRPVGMWAADSWQVFWWLCKLVHQLR